MKTIRVNLGQNSYNICIDSGILSQTGLILRELGLNDKAVIITNPTVEKLHSASLKQSLASKGFRTTTLFVPDGEEYKSLESAGKLYHQLTESGAERTTPLLALGGGVIGDLAGFVAATYMRGVPLVQLPTTLLAQVDSSIGGKVAVNHGQLKNNIGAFHQPKTVISDTATLKTLPDTEMANGISEVIKYAVIKDKEFFTYLEKNLDLIKSLDDNALETIIAKSVQIKAEVVENDEKDMGLRNTLNFGHTIGHAIETVSDFEIAHGQAVAIGMIATVKIAAKLGIIDPKIIIRLEKLLKRAGLMTRLPRLEVKQIMQAMQYDKKVQSGKIRFILPRAIGEVFITNDVNPALVEKILTELK
jgi:3-dehydroquinate synthase